MQAEGVEQEIQTMKNQYTKCSQTIEKLSVSVSALKTESTASAIPQAQQQPAAAGLEELTAQLKQVKEEIPKVVEGQLNLEVEKINKDLNKVTKTLKDVQR